MATLDALISAITDQNEYMTSISVAGMGVNVLVFGSLYGIVDEFNLRGFRGKYWLFLPFILFLFAYIAGGIITSSTTGFYVDVLQNPSNTCGADPSVLASSNQYYYICEYLPVNGLILFAQYMLNLVAILLTAFWFSLNVLFLRRKKNDKFNAEIGNFDVAWNYYPWVDVKPAKPSPEPVGGNSGK